MNALNIIIVITVAALFTLSDAGVTVRGEEPIDWYDCSGKANGNYVHPHDCNAFIHCNNGYAFEELCAPCVDHPVTCPDGRLRFSERVQYCVWASEAICQESPSTKPRRTK